MLIGLVSGSFVRCSFLSLVYSCVVIGVFSNWLAWLFSRLDCVAFWSLCGFWDRLIDWVVSSSDLVLVSLSGMWVRLVGIVWLIDWLGTYWLISVFDDRMSCVLVIMIVGTIYYIMLDEICMGSCQLRVGPMELGTYGVLASVINGLNLIMAQFKVPKVQYHIMFKIICVLLMIVVMNMWVLLYPFFQVDFYMNVLWLLIMSSLSVICLVLVAFAGCGKYSILGMMRLISSLFSFECIFSSIIIFSCVSYYSLTISAFSF